MSEKSDFLDSMDSFDVAPEERTIPEDTDIVEAAPEHPGLDEDTADVDDAGVDQQAAAGDAEAGDTTTDGGDTVDLAAELERERREKAVWEQRYKERQSLEDKRWNQYQQELAELKRSATQKPPEPAPDFSEVDPEYLKAAEYLAEKKLREFQEKELPTRVEAWQRQQEDQQRAVMEARRDEYVRQFDRLKDKGLVTEELVPAMTEYYQEHYADAIANDNPVFVVEMLEYAR